MANNLLMRACYRLAAAVVIPLFALAIGGCGGGGGGGGGAGGGGSGSPADPGLPPAPPVPTFAATLAIVDETGLAVSGATATLAASGLALPVPADGRLRLDGLDGPALAVVEAPGFLPEPVVVGREHGGGDVAVRLLAASGPGGDRLVLHFAGDFMLARRYLAPTSEGTAVVVPGDGGASARAVVASIAPLFRAAHVRSLNVETVIGTLPRAAAYPKKRFLLQSPPEALAALDELGTSVAVLGNNHARDWLDPGIASTLALLDGARLTHCGAGLDEARAGDPAIVDAAGFRIGFLSYTTVDGSVVNDSLPGESVPVPSPLDPAESWPYESRAFGFTGATVSIPAASRRIGTAWRLIEPADGPATHSVALAARLDGGGRPFVRLDVYNFDDSNPTEDPESTLFRQVELPLAVPPDGVWREALVDIPATALLPSVRGAPANAVLFYVGLLPAPAGAGSTSLLVDDVRFYEWREAGDQPDAFLAVDAVRALGAPVTRTLERTAD